MNGHNSKKKGINTLLPVLALSFLLILLIVRFVVYEPGLIFEFEDVTTTVLGTTSTTSTTSLTSHLETHETSYITHKTEETIRQTTTTITTTTLRTPTHHGTPVGDDTIIATTTTLPTTLSPYTIEDLIDDDYTQLMVISSSSSSSLSSSSSVVVSSSSSIHATTTTRAATTTKATTTTTLIIIQIDTTHYKSNGKIFNRKNYNNKVDLSIQNISSCNPECIFEGLINVTRSIPKSQHLDVRIDTNLPYSYKIYDENMVRIPDRTFNSVERGELKYYIKFTPSPRTEKFSVTYIINNLYALVEDPWISSTNITAYPIIGKTLGGINAQIDWYINPSGLTNSRTMGHSASTGGTAATYKNITVTSGLNDAAVGKWTSSADTICTLDTLNVGYNSLFAFSDDGYLVAVNESGATDTFKTYNFTGTPVPDCALVCTNVLDTNRHNNIAPKVYGSDAFVLDSGGYMYSIDYKDCTENWKTAGPVGDANSKTIIIDDSAGVAASFQANTWVFVNTSDGSILDTIAIGTGASYYAYFWDDTFLTTNTTMLLRYDTSNFGSVSLDWTYDLGGNTNVMDIMAIDEERAYIYTDISGVTEADFIQVINHTQSSLWADTMAYNITLYNSTDSGTESCNSTSVGDNIGAGIFVDAMNVYVGCAYSAAASGNGQILVFNKVDGTFLHKFPISYYSKNRPQIYYEPVNDRVVLGFQEINAFKIYDTPDGSSSSSSSSYASTTSSSSYASSTSSSSYASTTSSSSYASSSSESSSSYASSTSSSSYASSTSSSSYASTTSSSSYASSSSESSSSYASSTSSSSYASSTSSSSYASTTSSSSYASSSSESSSSYASSTSSSSYASTTSSSSYASSSSESSSSYASSTSSSSYASTTSSSSYASSSSESSSSYASSTSSSSYASTTSSSSYASSSSLVSSSSRASLSSSSSTESSSSSTSSSESSISSYASSTSSSSYVSSASSLFSSSSISSSSSKISFQSSLVSSSISSSLVSSSSSFISSSSESSVSSSTSYMASTSSSVISSTSSSSSSGASSSSMVSSLIHSSSSSSYASIPSTSSSVSSSSSSSSSLMSSSSRASLSSSSSSSSVPTTAPTTTFPYSIIIEVNITEEVLPTPSIDEIDVDWPGYSGIVDTIWDFASMFLMIVWEAGEFIHGIVLAIFYGIYLIATFVLPNFGLILLFCEAMIITYVLHTSRGMADMLYRLVSLNVSVVNYLIQLVVLAFNMALQTIGLLIRAGSFIRQIFQI